MQMGKLRDDPHHHHHHQYLHHQSKTQKPVNKTLKKSVKITYISSPLLVRACDASEFRAVVQQLTGKDSNNFIDEGPHQDPTLSNKEPPIWVAQDGAPGATMAAEDGKGPSYYDMSSRDPIEFDEGYFWKAVAHSVLQSPCVLV